MSLKRQHYRIYIRILVSLSLLDTTYKKSVTGNEQLPAKPNPVVFYQYLSIVEIHQPEAQRKLRCHSTAENANSLESLPGT